MTTTLPVLWHFTFSHFNEKARWALDFKGIPHARRALLPVAHYPKVWWATGQRTTPVLILDGKAISDSTRIIAALETYRPDPPLYPRDPAARARALALEEFFDEELGHFLRRVAIDLEADNADYAAAVFTLGFGASTRRVMRALYPLVFRIAKPRFDQQARHVSPEGARTKMLDALDRIERELQPSGYLVGDCFSVADLTACALLTPLLIPPEFPYPWPALPERTARYRESLKRRPAFGWARDIYRRHRGTSAEIAA